MFHEIKQLLSANHSVPNMQNVSYQGTQEMMNDKFMVLSSPYLSFYTLDSLTST